MPMERNRRRDRRRRDVKPKRMIPTTTPAVLLPGVEEEIWSMSKKVL